MTRRRWIFPSDGSPSYEVSPDYVQAPEGVLIVPDLPGYVSPVTGLWVEGRKARREDLKRTGSRPYEGIEQEKKEVARQQAYAAEAAERSLDKCAHETYYQLSPSKRDILKWHSERN